MISYCICCFRPKYDVMLIEDLIRKTSVPYEILVWINTPDRGIVAFINGLVSKGVPIRIVGDTPHNIGMAAFKSLFLASKYELITQMDDDVLRVSPGIAQKCMDIFRRRSEVKYLVSDTWIDNFTNGNRPGMDSYKLYSEEDALYDGPIDSWFGVYHRSILNILMQAPYDKYFFLGSFVRGILPRFKQIGLLCKKFKVLHACGPIYNAVFGLLDFEVQKFRSVNSPGMADSYAKANIPPAEKVLASFENAKRHIDAFNGEPPSGMVESRREAAENKTEDVVKETVSPEGKPNWEDARGIVGSINAHYGISEDDLRVIFDLIKDCSPRSVIVEIGVCHGRTSAMLAYVAKYRKSEYHGIDRFDFDGTSKGAVEESLRKLDLSATFYEGDSNGHSGRPLACPKWDKPINFLFIDGGHDEFNIRGDCEMWLPRVAPGGVVMFDDWNDMPPHSNAHWGIKYYSEFYCRDWEIVRTNKKLHIRRKPAVP